MGKFFWNICAEDAEQIGERVKSAVESSRVYRIATANLEYSFEARKNQRFRDAVGEADAVVCDGAGLQWWLRWRFGMRVSRTTGVDLVEDILRMANTFRWRIFFVVRDDGLSLFGDIDEMVSKRFPDMHVSGSDVNACDENSWQSVLEDIEKEKPHIVLCNFGIPEQEYFLRELARKDIAIVSIGVGGALDFLVGNQIRAPRWMRRVGLEWLWRFARNPRRLIRFLKRMV
jgi:N-acetylglucosaminyldiphosphoundecaprenol N-acetyl-beta-D-mannosaminyltransferase